MNNVISITKAPGLPPKDSSLFSIVYVSIASKQLSPDELHYLQQRAQSRNAQHEVTGVLLYSSGAFMQYLEGPGAGLLTVYDVIKSDPQHFGVIDLVREPIAQREFSDWSMALHIVGMAAHVPQTEQDTALRERLSLDSHSSSVARTLLLKFWERGRHAVAPVLTQLSATRLKRGAGERNS